LVVYSPQARANGVSYIRAVVINACASGSGPQQIEYDLGRGTGRLQGVVAFRDDAPSTSAGVVAAYLDGIEAFKTNLSFGQSVPYDFATNGALRLRLEVASFTTQNCAFSHFVFGDPKVTF
jgi:hypothetical protein